MRIKGLARTLVSVIAISAGSMASAQLFSNTGDWASAFTKPDFTSGLSALSGLTGSGLLDNTDLLGSFTGLLFNPLMMDMMLKPAVEMMDPELFTSWMTIALQPEVISSVLKLADPAMIEPMMGALLNPKIWEAMLNFATPEMTEAFMQIMMNPEWMTAMVEFASPEMWDTWMRLAFNPTMIETAIKFMEPDMLKSYVGMMTDPKFMDAMLKMMDPELMTSMMTAMIKMSVAVPGALGSMADN